MSDNPIFGKLKPPPDPPRKQKRSGHVWLIAFTSASATAFGAYRLIPEHYCGTDRIVRSVDQCIASGIVASLCEEQFTSGDGAVVSAVTFGSPQGGSPKRWIAGDGGAFSASGERLPMARLCLARSSDRGGHAGGGAGGGHGYGVSSPTRGGFGVMGSGFHGGA
ncbi:hypothetical protein ABEG18_11695 [Alsobacter sp. KACC 23698]|uniref:DUF1190 domain-containing protein n=1 Tax=Alsobacter sp. KACC 23698 TaxID=3149229 RepID=A0AAU7JMC8_9HYPH